MLIPGESFSSYRVIREIGRGAMGAVFEAEHVQLRKRVAIKVLLPEAANDRAAVQRFLREGEAAARLRHEHIVDVSDVGTRDGAPYLVMEYLDGESLADRLARRRRLEDTDLVDLVIPVCDALAVAHESGVIHRDVKPENIFLSRTHRGGTRAMLVDFGISHVTHADPKLVRLTSSSVLIGTPCYLSPEAARSAHNVDARSDQYAFGVTLYECRTGLLPFERPSIFEMISAILLEDPVAPSQRAAGVDPRLEAVILRAMSRHPDDRFPDMRALGLALLPMASPTVRAQWEPELRDHARADAKRTPMGAFDPARTRPVSTADDLSPLPLAEDIALARTDPDGLAPLPSDAASAPESRPERPRPRFVGVALAAGVAIAATVIALGSQRPAPPLAAAPVAPRAVPVTVLAPAAPESAVPARPAMLAAATAAPVTAVAARAERPRHGTGHVARRIDPVSLARPTASAVAAPSAPPAATPPPAAPPPRSLLRTDFGATNP